MSNHKTEQSFLLSFVSMLTTLGYLSRDPSFTWLGSLPYLLPSLTPLILSLPSWMQTKDFFYRNLLCLRTKPHHLEFTARLRLRAWMDEPDSVVRNFSVLLWEWNRANKVVNCQILMEEALSRYYDSEEMTRILTPIFVDDPNTPFWNNENPDIQYTMWVDRPHDREGNAMPEIFLRFQFVNPAFTPNKIVEHIEWIKTEAKKITESRKKAQRVLVTTDEQSSRGDGDNSASFMIYEFSTTSSFSNFFASEASQVKDDLDHFLLNRQAYYRTGRPWTYTILNEGVPGVGKTKLVKAIAAYTGATLIVLNLQHIQDIRTLYNVFHSSALGGEHVPHDKRVYYIPEVDTQALESLGKRSSNNKQDAVVVPSGTTSSLDGPIPATSSLAVKKKPTLGEILNVLDGVPERHGHILILDTNHLANLDPAMIRPGRVDRILTWRRMTGDNVRKYLENLYNTTIPKSVVFPDEKWTAAELQALAYRASSWDILYKQLFQATGVEKLNSVVLDRPKRACRTK